MRNKRASSFRLPPCYPRSPWLSRSGRLGFMLLLSSLMLAYPPLWQTTNAELLDWSGGQNNFTIPLNQQLDFQQRLSLIYETTLNEGMSTYSDTTQQLKSLSRIETELLDLSQSLMQEKTLLPELKVEN